MRIIKLDENSKKNILNDLLKRSPNNYDSYSDKVAVIVNDVKESRKVGERYMSYMTFQEFAKYEARAIVEEEIREEILAKYRK